MVGGDPGHVGPDVHVGESVEERRLVVRLIARKEVKMYIGYLSPAISHNLVWIFCLNQYNRSMLQEVYYTFYSFYDITNNYCFLIRGEKCVSV